MTGNLFNLATQHYQPVAQPVPAEAIDYGCSFIWLELTQKCNLHCVHCYNDSGPKVSHGNISNERWHALLDEAAECGVKQIQFIGGEPTLHPEFRDLVRHARRLGFWIEVFSNLVHISDQLWELFEQCHVSLATSFYSLFAAEHDKITTGRSQERTLHNIVEALRRNIPIRVGLIEVTPEQDVISTEKMLRGLGVKHIRIDRARHIGRGGCETEGENNINELCGRCGHSRCAIDSNGNVTPCVFSRWLVFGNVHKQHLKGALGGMSREGVQRQLDTHFSQQIRANVCEPRGCTPTVCIPDRECLPSGCTPACIPTAGECLPSGACAPNCSPPSCDPVGPCDPDSEPCNPETPPCDPDSGPCDPDGSVPCDPDGSGCTPNEDPDVRRPRPRR
jgi:MoaA/NifB/PqqE/SkfB family radical SAM enzyme